MGLLVGDGPDRAKVERAVSQLQLQDRVTMAGRMSAPDALDAIASAEVLVSSSLQEGLPVVLMCV